MKNYNCSFHEFCSYFDSLINRELIHFNNYIRSITQSSDNRDPIETVGGYEVYLKSAPMKVKSVVFLQGIRHWIESDIVRFNLTIALEDVKVINDYQVLNSMLGTFVNKYEFLSWLFEQQLYDFHTCLSIFKDLRQISLKRIHISRPIHETEIRKPQPTRFIGIGYRDSGSARESHRKVVTPSDARKQQYELELRKAKAFKQERDTLLLMKGFLGI